MIIPSVCISSYMQHRRLYEIWSFTSLIVWLELNVLCACQLDMSALSIPLVWTSPFKWLYWVYHFWTCYSTLDNYSQLNISSRPYLYVNFLCSVSEVLQRCFCCNVKPLWLSILSACRCESLCEFIFVCVFACMFICVTVCISYVLLLFCQICWAIEIICLAATKLL